MLPFLPVLDPLAEETEVVDQVEQLDVHEAARGLSPEFDTDRPSSSPDAHDQAIAELVFEVAEDTVEEVATAKAADPGQDRQRAVGLFFDQLGTAGNVAVELIPQLALLPPALEHPVLEESPPTQSVAAEPAPAPAAVVASSPVAPVAAESPSSTTHVPTMPQTTTPTVIPPSAPSPAVVEQTTTIAVTTETAQLPLQSTPAIEATPPLDTPPQQSGSAAPVAIVQQVVTPAPPVATTVAEPQSTTANVSDSPAVVLANFEADSGLTTSATVEQITESEVGMLLSRAAKATASEDAIIAIVDRGGHILGVHVEQGVVDAIPDIDTRVFAIDGAVAKARTAAFFSNNQAPLTSRTVRFISQTTITQREVQSSPNVADPTVRGPGFVAPIGLGGHFPPDVLHTPHVDLFAIEHTNRDSLVHAGVNRIKEAATVDADGNIIAKGGDDIFLGSRFGANFVAGQEIDPPESYGVVSDLLTSAQSRGIGTLPGGVPLYKLNPMTGKPELVGGIGVFFPGADGFADHEQGFVAGIGQTTGERTNADLVLEAEYTAGIIADNTTTIGGMAPVTDFLLPRGRIDLVGLTLESLGPHPGRPDQFLTLMGRRFTEGVETGTRMRVTPTPGDFANAGQAVPFGWLVNPTASADGLLSAADVEKIILDGVDEADLVRSAIRLPLGTRSKMVLAVADKEGEILGLFRMPDSTFFSIDVAVAKSRNVVYYADPADLLSIDQFDFDGDGTLDVPAGTALTNRTFRFLAEARFPSGVDGSPPPPFSILNDPGINPLTAENLGAPTAATAFTTVLGFNSFNPSSNFHEPVPGTGFQNGIVFFPGSSPLYGNSVLVGGFGVSGDGVDQDDVVTFSGAGPFLPLRGSGVTRSDQVFVDGVRLPYQKFLRNPRG